MAGLQRSAVSFRRQGSSGLIWDDKIVSGELNQLADQLKEEKNRKQDHQNKDDATSVAAKKSSRPPELKIERSRSNGGRGYRAGKVTPAVEPPSPKVSACGFCSAFGKSKNTHRRPPKAAKRVK